MRKHRHVMATVAWCGKEIEKKCKSCDYRSKRPMTKREQANFDKSQKRLTERTNKLHKVWHEFSAKFMAFKDTGPITIGGKTYKKNMNRDGWKYQGFDFMERVERWAKKYPKDVYVLRIDDSYHASSDLVFVLHRSGERTNWGTSVVVITQCDGIPPKEYFMYPGHAKGIAEVLNKINKMPWTYKD